MATTANISQCFFYENFPPVCKSFSHESFLLCGILLIFITILSSHSLTIQLFSNLFMALVSLVLALCSHFQGTYILCVVVCPCSAVFDHFSCHFVKSCTRFAQCKCRLSMHFILVFSHMCVHTYTLYSYIALSCNTLQTSHHNWIVWENEPWAVHVSTTYFLWSFQFNVWQQQHDRDGYRQCTGIDEWAHCCSISR